MDNVTGKILSAGAVFFMLTLSVLASMREFWWMFLIELILIEVLAILSSDLGLSERLSVFYLVCLIYLPLNIRVVFKLFYSENGGIFAAVFESGIMVLMLAAMLAAEELTAGYIMYLLRPIRQKKEE